MPRFQADNDLRSAIRTGVLRSEPAIDFRSAQTALLDGVPDEIVLQICAAENRILVSHDVRTMPGVLERHIRSGRDCSGLLIVPQDSPTAAVIESILTIWVASEMDEWQNRLGWLPL